MKLSLRWRLTLWSTFILSLVVALFGVIAYLSVNNASALLYEPIDSDLRRISTSNTLHMFMRHTLVPENSDPLSSVSLSVVDTQGHTVSGGQALPLNPELLQTALEGPAPPTGGVIYTASLPDSTRVRVMLSPIDMLSRETGLTERNYLLVAATRLDSADRANAQLRQYLIIASVIVLLLAASGSYLVSGRALQEVNNITRQARTIETSHDLSQRIRAPGSNDEIGDLVGTFNQMLERLEMAFAAQRRFVADSSHELRTPITVIRGNLHLMRKAIDPAERTELIDITEGEISRLNRMVNDLLYMAQMQAGYDLKPVLRPVELDSLLLDVFALARAMAALKDLRIVLVHEDVATVAGDREQLQHLLLNLVDNAVKYTAESGVVTLGLWAEDGWARIEVGDTGPGVTEEDMPLLFDRFFRSHEARKTARDGAGLGLSIVKSIADSHRGRVDVYSKVGEGTTFRVWLPLSQTGAPSAPAEDDSADGATGRVRRVRPSMPSMNRFIRPRPQEET
jgi:signal transduction histidine kinase